MRRRSRCGTDIGRRADGGLAVHLGLVRGDQLRGAVRRNLPLTGNPPKPLISGMPARWSSGRAPPPAPTNTKRVRTVRRSPVTVSLTVTIQRPSVSRCRSATRWLQCTATPRVPGVVEHHPGEGAEVDVGAGDRPRGGHGLLRVAAGHHQRQPGGEDVGVLGVLEPVEQRLGGERRVPGAHVGAAVLAGHEADVRHRGDELLRRPGHALAHQVRPELPGHLELLVDRRRPWSGPPGRRGPPACSSARRARRARCRRCSRRPSSRRPRRRPTRRR